MNERIRELVVRILPNEKEFHQGDPKEWGYFFTGEELEKFAELIIEECMRMCDVAAVGYESHGDIKEANGAVLARKYIAEQFGV